MKDPEACVLAVSGPSVEGAVVIRVQLNGVSTEPGQSIVMTGDCPELGNWNPGAAFRLEYINRSTWLGELVFGPSIGKPISYKFVILHEKPDAAPVRENRVVRRRSIPSAGESKWRDVWNE